MSLPTDQDSFARMDSIVKWCRENKLYYIENYIRSLGMKQSFNHI